MVKLGEYAEIRLASDNVDQSIGFYEVLGFRKLGDDVMTDGCINVHFIAGIFESPTLSYASSDIDEVSTAFKREKQKRKGKPGNAAEFKDPSGLRVTLREDASLVAMPQGTPSTRQPISLCGKFGELTIPVKSLPESLFFWTKLGYEPLHMAEIPYPYAILSDGLMVLGLHQSQQTMITLTYFAPNMAERIAKLREKGVDIKNMTPNPNDRVIRNGSFTSPERQVFFLFQGDI